mgnify:CR=1 FL=1
MANPLYFQLEVALTDDTIMVDPASHEDFYFDAGSRFDVEVIEPIEFVVDEGIGGDTWPTALLPQPLFRREFLDHLRQLGVSNLDDYAARIVEVSTGREQLEYRAVNIVGTIECADLALSTFNRFDDLYQFDRLVIDPIRAGGALMFRLAENTEIIVVSKVVAAKIDLSLFTDLVLIPLDSP